MSINKIKAIKSNLNLLRAQAEQVYDTDLYSAEKRAELFPKIQERIKEKEKKLDAIAKDMEVVDAQAL